MVRKSQNKNNLPPSRRNFLKNAAISSGVVAGVLVSSNNSNAQPPQFSDEVAIQKLAIKFIDATNRRDVELLRSLWTEDGVWDLGEPINKTLTGVENIATHWENMLGQYDFVTQIVNNGIIDVNSDRAKAHWYMQEFAHSPTGKGMMNYGLYLDELERYDGEWLFVRRDYRVLYLEEFDASGQVFALPDIA